MRGWWNIAKADDVFPFDSFVSFPEFSLQPRSCFANYEQFLQNSTLAEFIE